MKKNKATVFFFLQNYSGAKPLQTNQNGTLNRKDGDEDHGLDGTAPIFGAKAGSSGRAVCGCRSDRRGM
jgi:hypothetical protein